MNRVIVAVATLLPLAACQGEPEVDVRNASVEEVANEVAAVSGDEANFIRPGQWTSTMTIEQLEAPGMPAEVTERMKSMMGENRAYESCLTEADAKKPKEDFFAGKDNSCRYDHFTMGDGKIDARMRCSQQGVSQVMEMAGNYSPESYQMRMSTSMEGAGPTGGMTMRMRVDAKRVGECAKKTA